MMLFKSITVFKLFPNPEKFCRHVELRPPTCVLLFFGLEAVPLGIKSAASMLHALPMGVAIEAMSSSNPQTVEIQSLTAMSNQQKAQPTMSVSHNFKMQEFMLEFSQIKQRTMV